uniref:Uncharacterized protein n=1 Tax=Anguilla anguilla TaxID=7936 RepID=A0A0E9XIJ9_ANGAN
MNALKWNGSASTSHGFLVEDTTGLRHHFTMINKKRNSEFKTNHLDTKFTVCIICKNILKHVFHFIDLM